MTIFVLSVTEYDEKNIMCFKTKDGVIETIINDLKDRYHFDTDEPYLTQDELNEEINTMKFHIEKYGYWKDNMNCEYIIDECYLHN